MHSKEWCPQRENGRTKYYFRGVWDYLETTKNCPQRIVFLRKEKAYSYKRLASHFERPINTIYWYLRRLRAENKL